MTDYFDQTEIFTKSVVVYQAIKDNKLDLVFSDIEKSRLKGVDLHSSISNLNRLLVYVTDYLEYFLDAIKLQAFDYLMKLVKLLELEKSINRFTLNKSDNSE